MARVAKRPIGKDPNVVDALGFSRTAIRTARVEIGRAVERLTYAHQQTGARNATGEFDRALLALRAAQAALMATDNLTDAALDCVGMVEHWL